MELLDALINRRAIGQLTDPAPSGADLQRIQQAAMNVPDHARLQPWRFLMVEGEARQALGELYVKAAKQENPGVSAEQQQKCLQQPLRAPLLVVVIASIHEHPKVPKVEQLISAGCAAHNMLLAAEALGYGGIWRTGDMAFNDTVKQGLGLAENEEIIGFVYLGTPDGNAKPDPNVVIEKHWQSWP
jgi:nitroreductase